MNDKFREKFDIVRGDVLRAGYGSNPWADHDQVVTSVSWSSRVPDAVASPYLRRIESINREYAPSVPGDDEEVRVGARWVESLGEGEER
jgi:hypothetical protein